MARPSKRRRAHAPRALHPQASRVGARDPADPLNNYGQRLHVVQAITTGGATARVKVGVWRIDAWEEAAPAGSA